MPRDNVMSVVFMSTVVVLVLMSLFSPAVDGASYRRQSISCFKCNSRNASHSSCHDPIHPANTTYEQRCMVPKENHIGLFPALYCVKMKGKSVKTGEEVVIRSCSLETMDNQCGEFVFEGESFKGCIVTCTYDGCNAGNSRLVFVKMTRRRQSILMFTLMFLVTQITTSMVSAYGALSIPTVVIRL